MPFEGTLWIISACLTYSLQVILAYLVVRAICAFIRNPAVRVRLWGVFLLLSVAAWIYVWASSYYYWEVRPMQSVAAGIARFGNYALHRSWPINSSWDHFLTLAAAAAGRVYLLVFSLLVMEWQLKAFRLRSLLRSAEAPAPELQDLFQSTCDEMSLTGCTLQLIPDLRSPASSGIWRPRVLLPSGLISQLEQRQLLDVLRHELTHVSKLDYLWDRLAELACRMLFFHPALWLGLRRLRWERELACDQVVANCSDGRLRYAECLIQLARWLYVGGVSLPNGIGFSSASSLLAARVNALLHTPARSSLVNRAARLGLITVLAGVSGAVLPRISLTLHKPVRVSASSAAPYRPAARENHTTGRTTSRKARTIMAAGESLPPSALGFLGQSPGDAEQANAWMAFATPPPPVLAYPAATEVRPEKREGEIEPIAQSRVWDESPVGGGRGMFPGWRNFVMHATTAAIGISRSADDEPTPPRRHARVGRRP